MPQARRTAPPPSAFLARRVYHRSEHEPLQRALDTLGWREETKPELATIIWDVETLADTVHLGVDLQPHQLINRIPNMLHCCRKAVYARLLSRLRAAMFPPGSALDDGKYLPAQWALPIAHAELQQIVEQRAAEAKRHKSTPPLYIVKPDGGSMGDGITLTPDPCKAHSWEASKERVVQEYIGEPLLLDGLKFDLRLYVLVTAVQPRIKAYLYREGLARFAVDGYVAPSKDNLRNVHMHLTNYSLNKKSDNFKSSDAPDGGDDGSKRTVSSVFAALAASGVISDVEALWEEIGALVSRSLAPLQHVLAAGAAAGRAAKGGDGRGEDEDEDEDGERSSSCFQVLGFDVLLDKKARPWLIEINDHPSFRIDLSFDEPGQYSLNGLNSIPSPVDETIKVPMLTDALRVIGKLHSLRIVRKKLKRRKGGGAAAVAAAAAAAVGSAEGGDTAAEEEEGEEEEALDTAGADEPAHDSAAAAAAIAPAAVGPPPSDGAFGTAFHAVPEDEDGEGDEGFALLRRVADLFDKHTPAAVKREERAKHAAAGGSITTAPPENLGVPGPRWKGSATFYAFLQAGGLIKPGFGGGSSGGQVGLARPDVDLVWLATCGKGGSMGLLDFAEACINVAKRLWPGQQKEAHPSELLSTLLDTYYPHA